MKAIDFLKVAIQVREDRSETLGDNFQDLRITAKLWSTYSSDHYTPEDVAMMMVLLKVGRVFVQPDISTINVDHYTDIAGYAAIAGQLAYEEAQADLVKGTLEDKELEEAAVDPKTSVSFCSQCGYPRIYGDEPKYCRGCGCRPDNVGFSVGVFSCKQTADAVVASLSEGFISPKEEEK